MPVIRRARDADLPRLLRLEELAFSSDRLSRRSFQRWLRHADCIFSVCEASDALAGYILVILRRGTRLARLYSLAVDPQLRGQGIARRLIQHAESEARQAGALFMRLEVASNNDSAIALYRKLGYLQFGRYRDYYEDHDDALRMEKCIHVYTPAGDSRVIPWISQSLDFTCGPASLMMAMASLAPDYVADAMEEIQIWREATTIFMTSGHGGCHPVGLGLAAHTRGFGVEVLVNQPGPLFLDGVRDPNKKRVMSLVHEAFLLQARESGVAVHYTDVDQQRLCDSFVRGDNVLILISTYRMANRKAPHWVLLSGFDDSCLYVHDPDLDSEVPSDIVAENLSALDCQHIPIAKEDFAAMSRFGSNRLQAAVIVRAREPVDG